MRDLCRARADLVVISPGPGTGCSPSCCVTGGSGVRAAMDDEASPLGRRAKLRRAGARPQRSAITGPRWRPVRSAVDAIDADLAVWFER